MTNNQSMLGTIRRQYGALSLEEKTMHASPIVQAQAWLKQAIEAEMSDPTAMTLSTVDEENRPDARVVLLKEIKDTGFVFFTHYASLKGKQIKNNPYVALTFYWSGLVRQLRIRGSITQLEADESDAYFATRPYLSQLSACASLQSQTIPDRLSLETEIEKLKNIYPEGQVPRPNDWGGYLVTPFEMEFWQGRDNRLHDRVRYALHADQWEKTRLAP